MNIAIISDYNIGGIPVYLMRAINKYTDHKARCIIGHDDSFAYDRDIILGSDQANEEAADWVKRCEFFHFGRGIFNWPGVIWNNKILNRRNCCVEYYGSELRNSQGAIAEHHKKTGVWGITGTDWTITGLLPGSFYHLGQYLTRFGDMFERDVPLSMASSYMDGEIFRIATSSAGSPLKGYELLWSAIDDLKKEGVRVEAVPLTQMSNMEVLEKKLSCHATFTSIHGGWGMSGAESMFMGHIIFASLDSWTLSLYPDNPVVIVTKDTLKEKIRRMARNPGQVRIQSEETRSFALHNFRTTTILKRYLYLWDVIMNHERILEGGYVPKNIYDYF